jgi:hypothetical protein
VQTTDEQPDDRLSGGALAGASILSIVAMAHHPSGFGHDGLAQLVHGVMIAIVIMLLAGYARLASRLGLARFSNVLALITYGAGVVANIFAATINGFVVGDLAARGASEDILRLCWAFNQALAYGAVYATSIAFFIWGLSLVRRPGLSRIVGVLGLTAAIASAALLVTGALAMNVAGAFIVYSLQAAFGVLAGAELIRARE